MFGLPFEEIAGIVGRSPAATRQLASRARRRVQGGAVVSKADLVQQRGLVEAFLTALRASDFEGLLAVLDPDLMVRVDAAAVAPGGSPEIRGAPTWAKGALAFQRVVRFAQPALVNGAVGVILASRGRLFRALRFTFAHGRIAEVEVIADPARLHGLEVSVLSDN